jgi:osmotically-inducible protein OsmY
MKKFLFGFIFGIIVAVAAVWYLVEQNSTGKQTGDQTNGPVAQTNGPVAQTNGPIAQAREFADNKLDSLKLNASNIQDELARTGQVVRQKVQDAGKTLADATADARITTSIKGKLLASPDLSALSISVNTTDGRVTLSGTASSADNIGKAVQLAMETDGVNEVVSTLQIKKP